jgi:hypothetical protein
MMTKEQKEQLLREIRKIVAKAVEAGPIDYGRLLKEIENALKDAGAFGEPVNDVDPRD